MIYTAKVIRLGEFIEEEVFFSIKSMNLLCFVHILPCELIVGKVYCIEISPMVLDKYIVHERDDSLVPALHHVGNGFSYEVIGRLNDGKVDSGIALEDDFLKYNYAYLNGKMISWCVDRFDVEVFGESED